VGLAGLLRERLVGLSELGVNCPNIIVSGCTTPARVKALDQLRQLLTSI